MKNLKTGGTKEVLVEELRILCDDSGTEITAMYPGGGYPSPLYTPLVLKRNIENVFMSLSPVSSMLRVKPISIFKIATLRFYRSDLLLIEIFYHIVWKDQMIVPIGKENSSATFGDMMVMSAIKDLWEKRH